MNGETFFSTRPDHYKPTKSVKLKTARKNFAAATSFAKIINSLPQLKEIWLTAKISGRLSFNRIIKFNRKAFPLTLFIFFYFKNDNKTIFVELAGINAPSPDGNYNISHSLNVLTKGALKKDPHPLVYIAMAGVPQKRKIYWTSTVSIQL